MRKYDLVQSLQSDLLHKMAKTVWAYLAWSAWQSLPSSHYAKHHALSNIKHTSIYKETCQIRTSTAKMILTRATTTNTPATPIILSTAPDLKGSCWKYCFHSNKNISLSAGNSHCKQCFLNFWCWNWEGHFKEHPIWSVTGLGNQLERTIMCDFEEAIWSALCSERLGRLVSSRFGIGWWWRWVQV